MFFAISNPIVLISPLDGSCQMIVSTTHLGTSMPSQGPVHPITELRCQKCEIW